MFLIPLLSGSDQETGLGLTHLYPLYLFFLMPCEILATMHFALCSQGIVGSCQWLFFSGLLTSQAGVYCMLDGSVHQPTQWTVPNVAPLSITHLGGHAHL